MDVGAIAGVIADAIDVIIDVGIDDAAVGETVPYVGLYEGAIAALILGVFAGGGDGSLGADDGAIKGEYFGVFASEVGNAIEGSCVGVFVADSVVVGAFK